MMNQSQIKRRLGWAIETSQGLEVSHIGAIFGNRHVKVIEAACNRADNRVGDIDQDGHITRHDEVLIGLSVHFLFEHGLEGKQVPEELHEPLRVMHREMGEYHGSDQFSPALAARAKDLGVYDYLLEREGGFVGSAQDIRDRVVALGEAGAENLILAPYGDGRRIMARLADEVLPYV